MDHLLVDNEGVPILVEVKRSTDTRIRREVVAQMMDYACRASSWDVEKLKEAFWENNKDRKDDGKAKDLYESTEFWNAVETNLGAEHFRLVFVADRIPDTLRILIEFLDRSMDKIEVYGVEVKPIKNSNITFLSSNIVGNSLDIRMKPTYIPRQIIPWTEETFLRRTQEVMGESARDICFSLIEFCRTLDLDIVFGKGAKIATFTPKRNNVTVFGITQNTASSDKFVVQFYKDYVNQLGGEMKQVLNTIRVILEGIGMKDCCTHTAYYIWLDLEPFEYPEFRKGFEKLIRTLIGCETAAEGGMFTQE